MAEVGVGNGLNFAHYPQGVSEVVAIERCERFPFSPLPFPPRVAHILGVARRPEALSRSGGEAHA